MKWRSRWGLRSFNYGSGKAVSEEFGSFSRRNRRSCNIGKTDQEVNKLAEKSSYKQEVAQAVAWAKAKGVSNGQDLNKLVTRAQLLLMLYRALNK
jgi:hypothetical protein